MLEMTRRTQMAAMKILKPKRCDVARKEITQVEEWVTDSTIPKQSSRHIFVLGGWHHDWLDILNLSVVVNRSTTQSPNPTTIVSMSWAPIDALMFAPYVPFLLRSFT